MNDLRLRDKGNMVLVVEHEPETIAVAGHDGRRIAFAGTRAELVAHSTLTGAHLAAYIG
jgi:excinuclease UvrABC ATPase subunit